MSSLNSVQLIGRLGQDPTVRHLDNGNVVASFSVATSYKYKDKAGEQKEVTEWSNCVVWGALAEKVVAKYLHKGNIVYCAGRLTTRSYEKDGVTRYITEVVLNDVVLLPQGSPGQNGAASSSPYANQGRGGSTTPKPDPFDDAPGGQNVDSFSTNPTDILPF